MKCKWCGKEAEVYNTNDIEPTTYQCCCADYIYSLIDKNGCQNITFYGEEVDKLIALKEENKQLKARIKELESNYLKKK